MIFIFFDEKFIVRKERADEAGCLGVGDSFVRHHVGNYTFKRMEFPVKIFLGMEDCTHCPGLSLKPTK